MRDSHFVPTLSILALCLFAAVRAQDGLCQAYSAGSCTYCVYSYPGSNGCQAITTVIPGCYSYSSSTTCKECQDGYYFNPSATIANQTCVALDQSIRYFCAYSSISTTSCSSCGFGVLADAGNCIASSQCSDPNCNQCILNSDGTENCRQCNQGYMRWAGSTPAVCILSNALSDCYETSNLNSCSNCNVGYYLYNGTCSSSSSLNYGSSFRLVLSGLIAMVSMNFLF